MHWWVTPIFDMNRFIMRFVWNPLKRKHAVFALGIPSCLAWKPQEDRIECVLPEGLIPAA